MVGDEMSQPDLGWLRAERDGIHNNNLHLQSDPLTLPNSGPSITKRAADSISNDH
jgi:hypothetical protein